VLPPFASTSTPEPTSTIGLLALGTLGAASTLKRQLKSSKSSEKETTKVS
ncbi:MAG: PEP-CTERM sorting domain-containing protein, partial [Microcystis panniformis]